MNKITDALTIIAGLLLAVPVYHLIAWRVF
jgi:hypothetical protein